MRYDGMSMVYDKAFLRFYDAPKSEAMCNKAIMKKSFRFSTRVFGQLGQ